MQLLVQLLARRMLYEQRGETITPPDRRKSLLGDVRGHLLQSNTTLKGDKGHHNTTSLNPLSL